MHQTQHSTAPLAEGDLHHWNDAKGFGFIRVGRSEPDLFVHISAFAVGTRPQVGDRIVFARAARSAADGRPRAVDAVVKGPAADTSPYRPQPASRATVHRAPARAAKHRRAPRDTRLRALQPTWGLFGMVVLTGLCMSSAVLFAPMSPLPMLLYPVASLAAFVFYGHDKARAISGGWRVPEATLHLLELAGGWPGAWVAQQTMRHKTVKLSYQITYWLIVTAHLVFWGLWWWLPPETVAEVFAAIGRFATTR